MTGGLGDFRSYLTSAQDMFSPTAFQQFQNPYEDAVERTISDAMDADAMRNIADRARQVSSGAFGSERGRLMEGERTRQFARGLGESLAVLGLEVLIKLIYLLNKQVLISAI